MREAKKYDWENLLFLDIETVPVVQELSDPNEPLYESFSYGGKNGTTHEEIVEQWPKVAALSPEFGKIVCITTGWVREGEIILKDFYGTDENKILHDFNEFMELYGQSHRKNTLAGHAVKGFDVPFIFRRMLIHGIEPAELLDTGGLKPWEINYLDTKDLWQAGSYRPSSLIHIAVAMGIESPKDDITGADVGRVYYEAEEGYLERIATYCAKDVITPIRLVSMWKGEGGNLKVRQSEATFEKQPLIIELFNGGKITTKNRDELIDLIKDEDPNHVHGILKALVASKTSKVTVGQLEKFYAYQKELEHEV